MERICRERMTSLDPEEICEWALDNLGGALTVVKLYQHYKDLSP